MRHPSDEQRSYVQSAIPFLGTCMARSDWLGEPPNAFIDFLLRASRNNHRCRCRGPVFLLLGFPTAAALVVKHDGMAACSILALARTPATLEADGIHCLLRQLVTDSQADRTQKTASSLLPQPRGSLGARRFPALESFSFRCRDRSQKAMTGQLSACQRAVCGEDELTERRVRSWFNVYGP